MERIKVNKPRVKLIEHDQPVRSPVRQAAGHHIDKLKPLRLAGNCDIDCETLHLFPDGDGSIAVSFITKTGSTNILLRRRTACELNEALTYLLEQ
jgi:hypothetical protein